MARRKRKKKGISAVICTVLVIVLLAGCVYIFGDDVADLLPNGRIKRAVQSVANGIEYVVHRIYPPSLPNSTVSTADGLTVEFIDVGQADCILIYTGECAMLIDGGNNEDGPLVAKYLRELGVSKLDYVIATHPHEDHIGGLDDVLNAIQTDNVVLPLVASTTKTYADLLDAVMSSNASVVKPHVGSSYELGEAVWTIISCEPVDATNYNECSVCVKLSYGDIDFILTGDAEEINEQAILRSGYDLSAEIYKAGHHGSYTSNSELFLRSISPTEVIISCGANNDYGHPHQSVVERFEKMGCNIYRTDMLGTVVVQTDGSDYYIDSKNTNTNGQQEEAIWND